MKKYGKRLLTGLVICTMMLGMEGCAKPTLKHDYEKATESVTESSEQDDTREPVTNYMTDDSIVNDNTNSALQEIKGDVDQYFYFDSDEQAMQEGIIRGYMESLDDPYSVYYNPEEYAEFLESTNGEYVGVGVQVSQNKENMVITITRVFDGPAKEAGIIEEDILTKVDGEDVTEQDIDAVVDKIRGVEGTPVTITVYRPSDKQEHDCPMERRKVENPTVEYEMLDNNIGYISVSSFYEVTGDQYIAAIEDLDNQGMEGLIVDLRSNGGGLLDVAVKMLDYMLPAGKLVYTEDKAGNVTSEYNSTDEHQFNKPLVVMVNGYSASASEIFAGAIKDYGTGTLVGTTTFGKGIVQRMFDLKDGSAIKLTIAKYFTPSGNDIHKVGIEPDVEVELDVDAYRESEGANDNQLNKAKEVLLEEMSKN